MVPQSNESESRQDAPNEASPSHFVPPADAPSAAAPPSGAASEHDHDAPGDASAPNGGRGETNGDAVAVAVPSTIENGESDGEEGDDSGTEPESSAPTEGAAGAPREKKRRRRRRGKKGPGATAGAPGVQASANGEAATPKEGEAVAEGGVPAANADARPREGTGKDGGKEKAGARSRKDSRKKPRAPRPETTAPRERAAFHVGEEVFGRVTSVTEHAIMVDLSGKALAIFDRHELAEDDLVPEVGDRFVAHVHGDGSRGGLVVLTRKPLREEEAKPRLEAAATSGEVVNGLVTGVVKGGIEVDVDGVRAFAPGSHVDLRPGADLAHLIGRRLEFHVAQYAKRGRDVVVSRKNFIESEAKEHRKSSLAKLEPGSVVKGVVRSVVAYGAFVAIPGADDVEGLVHMTEASHDRSAKLSDVFKVGAEIDVKVLRVDEKGKLWLSHRAATTDPWDEAMKTFAQGTRHKGKVLRMLPFGAFIELAPGVEGLMHTADLSFKRIEHPQDVLKDGEEIDVVVAEVERGSHKISLHPAPPVGEENEPRQKIAPHKAVKVAVVAAESAGLVVRVVGQTGRHARAFIPAGHTGTERGTDLRKHFPPGTKLDAKVIEIDPRRGEAKLSLRALKEDTEKAAYNEYRASVAKASKFGTLGDLLARKR